MLVRPPPSTENASDSGACLDDRARWLALNWSAGGLAFRILVQKVGHRSSIYVTDIELFLRCLGMGRHLMSEIGVFELLRQICLASQRFQHDVPLHQCVDAVGGGESFFPQLLDQ
jgi:hypothetical protein